MSGEGSRPAMRAASSSPGACTLGAASSYQAKGAKSSGRPIYVQNGGRHVCAGVLHGDRFIKTLRPEHILRHPPAIAVSTEVLTEVEAADCRIIECQVDDGRVLTAPLTAFGEYGFTFDRGFGAQTALPLRYWVARGEEQPKLLEV